jgi:hypothetical protein
MPEVEYVDVPTMRSVPAVTIPYRDTAVDRSVITFGALPQATESFKYEPIKTTAPAVVVPYERVERVEYMAPMYKDPYAIQPYVARHTFTHDFWVEVLRPLGIGIGAPIAGAAAFLGGAVCGAGALVGGCAVGLLSTVRGVFGFVQIGTDYVLSPVSHGIGIALSPMDRLEDKAFGVQEKQYDYEPFLEWFWRLFYGTPQKALTYEPMIIEERVVEPTFLEERIIKPTYISGSYGTPYTSGSYGRPARVIGSEPIYF